LFTGLIETTAKIISVSSSKLSIDLGSSVKKTDKLGDSISVNGVCLTVSDISDNKLSFDVSHETVSATNLKDLKSGNDVNIERALHTDGRFHGHFVTGHVDTVAKVLDIKKSASSWDITLVFEDSCFFKWIAQKGSISINGVSLTVSLAKSGLATIGLTLIPHTLKQTNLIKLKPADSVNVEFDILSKYVENLLFNSHKQTKNEDIKKDNLTEDKLRELGYVK